MSAGAVNAHSKSTVTSTSIHHCLPPVSSDSSTLSSVASTAAGGTPTPSKYDCRVPMTLSTPEPHRPDSPTSLEDSQSESGLDSFYAPTSVGSSDLTNGTGATSSSSLASSMTLSEMDSVAAQPRHYPKAAHDLSSSSSSDKLVASTMTGMDLNTVGVFDRNMTIHTGHPASSPMSPSQVATPPLSPAIEAEEDSLCANGSSFDHQDSGNHTAEENHYQQDQELPKKGFGKKETTQPNGPIVSSTQEPPRRSAESAVDRQQLQQQQQQQQQHCPPSLSNPSHHPEIDPAQKDMTTPLIPLSTLNGGATPATASAVATTVVKTPTPPSDPSATVDPSKAAAAWVPPSLAAPKPMAPPLSAWANLLPGVAPAPVPPPPAAVQSSTKTRSSYSRSTANDRRIHDLIPIVLPHDCEVKLTMEMIDLFETLLPTEESHARRTQLVHKIKAILDDEWPGEDILVHPFGSTENDLGTSSSDVDLCITTAPNSQLKTVQQLAAAFRRHGMQRVFCVPRAKVPIVKLWDADLHLSCDMNINNTLALVNTRMIKTYVAIDPRVRPFAMIIKHWARRRVLNDAANGGTISTYTWICIVINFLQMRSPPILPALHKIPHELASDNQVINGNNTSFCEDLAELEGFGLANKETLGGLLYAFFRRYAIEFDYDHHVISVREGSYLTKESKNWHIPGKQYKLLCVEEPLDTTRNLGNSSDMASTKGLREEFRRALDILHQRGSLHQVCQQWVFPPSYYHNVPRKGHYNPNNYTPGRRYTYGYRSQNYYEDDLYYDDDDDDDDEEAHEFPEMPQRESQSASTKTVTSLLGITFKKRSNSMPSSSNSGHHGSGGTHNSGSAYTKGINNSSAGHGSSGTKGIPSIKERSGTRTRRSSSASSVTGEASGDSKPGRARSSLPTSDETANTASTKSSVAQSGSSTSRSVNSNHGRTSHEKSSSGSGAGRTNRRQKSGENSNNSSGGGRRSGGSGASGNNGGSNTSGGSHRAPRSMVEFNLAEIASAAPKLMSRTRAEAAFKSEVTAGSGEEDPGSGANSASGAMGGGGSGGTSGSEGGSSVRGKKQKSRRHHNVVWSTNSSRGETLSSRGTGGSRNGAQQTNGVEAEKTKPIFVVAGDDMVGISRTHSTTPSS